MTKDIHLRNLPPAVSYGCMATKNFPL
jgi:hypothetical protein